MSTKEWLQKQKNSRFAKNARLHASMCIPKDKHEIVQAAAVISLPAIVLTVAGVSTGAIIAATALTAAACAIELHERHAMQEAGAAIQSSTSARLQALLDDNARIISKMRSVPVDEN